MNTSQNKALVLYRQSRYQLAIDELLKSLDNFSDDSYSYTLLALCFSDLKQFQEANKYINKALELEPEDAFIHEVHARVLYAQNKFNESIDAINKSIHLDPENADAFAILSKLLLNFRQFSKAIEAAETALTLKPGNENVECLSSYAQALTATGNTLKAESVYETILSVDPEDSYAHSELGGILMRKSVPSKEKALYHFRKALQLDPSSNWIKGNIILQIKNSNKFFRLTNKFRLRSGLISKEKLLIYYIFLCLGTRLLIFLSPTYPWLWFINFLLLILLITELFRALIFDVLILPNPLARQILFSKDKRNELIDHVKLTLASSVIMLWVFSGNLIALIGSLLILGLAIVNVFFLKVFLIILTNLKSSKI
jgi:tetratricopeptide (TPR) repeat protein